MRNTTPGSDILLALAAGLGPAGRIAKALDALAGGIEGGQLLASTDPGGLLLAAADRIAELEAEVVRLRPSAALHPYEHCTCADGQCGWCHRSAAVERVVELAENAQLRAALEQVRERTISPPGAEPEREIWRIADAALRWA